MAAILAFRSVSGLNGLCCAVLCCASTSLCLRICLLLRHPLLLFKAQPMRENSAAGYDSDQCTLGGRELTKIRRCACVGELFSVPTQIQKLQTELIQRESGARARQSRGSAVH